MRKQTRGAFYHMLGVSPPKIKDRIFEVLKKLVNKESPYCGQTLRGLGRQIKV